MVTKVNYKTIQYSFSSVYFEASGLRLEAATDIPEGAVLAIDSTGKLAIAGQSSTVVGVARFPVAQGGQCVCEPTGVVENKGTSLALTPGSAVYAAASGEIADTGTVKVGTAISADKVFINV